jgi:hypothetical protein
VYLVNNPGWDQEASEVFLSAMKTNVLITVAEVVPFFPAGLLLAVALCRSVFC